MTLDKNTKILIIGLGVIGGSYAKALSDKGYTVKCITKETADVRYGLEHGMISYGTTEVEPELVSEAELIIFALYPKAFISWIKKYQHLISPGALITDVTGIKSQVVFRSCYEMTSSIFLPTLWQDVKDRALNLLTHRYSTAQTIS